MTKSIKNLAIRTLATAALTLAALSSANAGVFIYRAPIIVAPVAVYVPTCRIVAVPVVNPYTGFAAVIARRVCN